MVVLRSTTLCVAVSSFTSSWRLTVISIAAPCAAGFSTSVSTIDIDHSSGCHGEPRHIQTGNQARFTLASLYITDGGSRKQSTCPLL